MNDKRVIMLLMVIGSAIGGYLPSLFGASIFSMTSIISSAIGGIVGIWIGMKTSN